MAVSVSKDYVKGTSINLPKLDIFCITQYIKNNDCFNDPEIRGSKPQRSSRENYGDSAIGYVQIKREGSICNVKAQICPEHRFRNKNYHVSLIINEEKEEIVDLHCDDCAASLGGCKHSLALLMYVHIKSEEKSPTEVECYWKRPKLY